MIPRAHLRTYETYNGGRVAARGRTVLRITAFGLSTQHDDPAPRCMRGVQGFLAQAVRSVGSFPASPRVAHLSGERGHSLETQTAAAPGILLCTTWYDKYLVPCALCLVCCPDFEAAGACWVPEYHASC